MTKKVKTAIATGEGAVRVVIVGPMRGKPDWNYPLFHEVKQAWLAQHPHDVVLNPAENFDGAQDRGFSEYLQASLEMVLSAQMVVLLPGWEQSEGASQYEVPVARVTHKIFYEAIPKGVAFGEHTGWEFEHIPAPANVRHYPIADKPTINAARQAAGLPELPELVRMFDTGATRDTEDGKLDYEGFLSPLVLERYAEYMHKHRKMGDNLSRTSDNWQKGIPLDAYMKSMWRHFFEVWKLHRLGNVCPADKANALCGVLFNAMGYLHELEKEDK